jgi:hypothetical protein
MIQYDFSYIIYLFDSLSYIGTEIYDVYDDIVEYNSDDLELVVGC